MGCDIHIVVQINKKKGFGWETVEEIPKKFYQTVLSDVCMAGRCQELFF